MTLGIDIGGTTISLGLVNGSEVVRKTTVPSFAADATQTETLEYLGDRIAEILTPEVEKIGIGVPSLTDPKRGIVYDAANIPSWDVVPLKDKMEERFGIPVSVNNDANCYVLGAALHLPQDAHTVVAVTLGTGTGVGIVVNGRLFSGSHCGAGEVGALAYNNHDYETFCSKKFFTRQGLDPAQLSKAADKGDDSAKSIFREFGEHLGEFLSVIMYAYDADHIVLGGGIANAFRHFSESMWEMLRSQYPYDTALDDLEIHVMPNAELAMVGAASL